MDNNIRVRAILGLSLTQRERARFLLFIATDAEMREFLKREKETL